MSLLMADEALAREAPVLTPEAELWRSLTAGLLATLGKEKGLKLLRAMAETLADRRSYATAVTPIRCDQERYARETEAKGAACAVFRRELPSILAALDDIEDDAPVPTRRKKR